MYQLKQKKSNKLFFVLTLLSTIAVAYVGYPRISNVLGANPLGSKTIEYVMYANHPDSVLLHTFTHPVYGDAKLYAGSDAKSGLRHILAVHTKKYFINYSEKNRETMFADDLDGVDILEGLHNFYKHCIKVDAYNRKSWENTTYIGFVDLKDVPTRCLMAVETNTGRILTFYPLNGIEEADLVQRRIWLD